MSVFENDYNLPGVYTYVEPDYTFGYDTSLFGTTDSVLIIGTAFDGPSGVVMPVYSKEHASYVFGKAYDPEKQEESSLVAGIHDAWERGCRTIYAVRVGGKAMYKDFKLRVDNHYFLRVASRFPTNLGKECYIRYDNTVGSENITFYKPAAKATISQRRAGVVESESLMLSTELQVNLDYGYTKDTPLADLLDLVNRHADNNVLYLSIVDKEGNDVTHNVELRNIGIGALYQGVYFIGRSESLCAEETEVKFKLVGTENIGGVEVSNKPYKRLDAAYFHQLIENTDINQPLPIYADKNTLRNVLKEVGVSVNTKKMWDWLNVTNLNDLAFAPDEIDYEETQLAGFELYQRLGMGYAITAKAERRTDSAGNEIVPRVKETPVDSPQHVVQIVDGLYGIIQDAPMKYRVLMCANATSSTKGKLPRAKDFLKAVPHAITVLNGLVELTPNVNDTDFTDARSYNIVFKNVPQTATASIDNAYTNEVFEALSILPDTEENGDPFELTNHSVPQGTKFFKKDGSDYILTKVVASNPAGVDLTEGDGLIGKKIVGVNGADNTYNMYEGYKDGDVIKFKKVTDFSVFIGKNGDPATLILADLVDSVFVFRIEGDTLVPNGDLNGMITDNQEIPVVYAEDMLFQPNDVIVNSSVLGDTTFEELVDTLNNHESFGQIFTATLTEDGATYKDEFVLSIIRPDTVDDPSILETEFDLDNQTLETDREISYDYNLYVPYRTTDNFARQFAQHCTYTELKTAPTWGFIGSQRVGNTDLAGVAAAVDSLASTNFDLYAKNAVGRNMLDRDNLPYPIGRNLSVTFTQYEVPIEGEAYTFYSNGAAGYAGMISRLPLDTSSTNQPFAVNDILFNLTQYQHSRLNAIGIVTLKRSFTMGVVVLDGTTMAPSDSVFRRLSASRIVGAVEELIRAVCEPYIGKQNHQANRNNLHTAIKSKLDDLLETLLEEYQFQIIVDRNIERFNYINIDYEIVPIYEIRQIRNRIKVVDTLSSTATMTMSA